MVNDIVERNEIRMANILVVEDDRHISELVKRNLTLVGHICTCVYDGLSGLDILEKQSLKIVNH